MFECRVAAREHDYVIVQLDGEFAGERLTETVRETLEEHYVDDGVRRIRLDLEPLRFIDLEGVAALLSLRRESRERGKRFTVERAGGQVREKLSVTGVLELLEHGD
jgi:anti-anti-sigma factor